MKQTVVLLPVLIIAALACSSEAPVATGTAEEREALSIRFVGTPELAVLDKPEEGAAVIATYQNGESVSILAEQGDWVEIRTGERAGWVRKADLVDAATKEAAESTPTPKFERMPMPVTATNAKGEIYFEADVNTDGDVVAIKLLQNTTGSDALASQNGESFKSAKFFPIVIDGERKPFKYYHKVTY
ncbi:MAG: SH3 domain-containing protein [Thermoanaerobaculia bacterium]